MKDVKSSLFGLSYEEILKANENPNIKRITVEDKIEPLISYFKNGMPQGDKSGIEELDDIFSWRNGFVYCFTGYPGSGKSEILKWLSVLRVQLHGDKIMMYSPESDEIEIIDDIARMYLGKNTNTIYPDQCTDSEYMQALDWVQAHYEFIDFEQMPTVQTLLDTYTEAVDRGFNFFVTDPFNYVAEGSSDDGQGVSRYLKTALSHMKTFAKRNKVINVIVEHPRQPRPDNNGVIPTVNQFMINGGAMWNNKMDCIVGATRDWSTGMFTFETLKMKSQRYNGVPGSRELTYDIKTGRYENRTPF
jgi:twinkle protein